jgi:hypothetical protein
MSGDFIFWKLLYQITVLEFMCIMHSHQFYIGAKLSQTYIRNLRETIFDMVNFKSFSLQSQFCDNVISKFVYTVINHSILLNLHSMLVKFMHSSHSNKCVDINLHQTCTYLPFFSFAF